MDFLFGKKRVHFHSTVNVILIPTKEEYAPLQLWYGPPDYARFYRDMMRRLHTTL